MRGHICAANLREIGVSLRIDRRFVCAFCSEFTGKRQITFGFVF